MEYLPRTFVFNFLLGVMMFHNLRQTDSQVPGPLAVRDYCQSEYFNATCAAGQVIMMHSAKYGRMSAGRCVTANHGFLGCSTDVLEYMDGKCGGRQKCRVYVAEPQLHDTRPCPRDFASYMATSYECIKVATGDEGECRGSHEILLTEPSGFISAQLDPTSEVGSNSCPWRIRVRRGQKISVKLFKFGTVITPEDNGISDAAFGANGRSNVCYELATVKEGAHERSLTTCSGEQRENIVYLSDSSMIDIVVLSSGTFLIHYEAHGCPEPMLAKSVWVRRQGDNLIAKCNLTEETWSLVCRGNSWVGEVGNCSKHKQSSQPWTFPIVGTTDDQFPYGILILVAIGVALGVFLGGLLLSVAIFYLKRKGPHDATSTPPHLADIQCEHPKLLDGENNQIPTGTWGRNVTHQPHHVIPENPADMPRGSYMPPCDVTVDVVQNKDCNLTGTYDRRRAERHGVNGTGTLRSSHLYESPQFT